MPIGRDSVYNKQVKLVLATIPEPKQGEAAVFHATEGFRGPFMKGAGNIDLLCGKCMLPLAEGMSEGQIEDLVLECPDCESFNAIIEIPRLEELVRILQAQGFPAEAIPVFRQIIENGIENNLSPATVATQIGEQLPELDWVSDLLIPKNAGEFFSILTFLLTVIIWFQGKATRRSATPEEVVLNVLDQKNSKTDRKKRKIGRNSPCHCGSGRKYKKCHGKRE